MAKVDRSSPRYIIELFSRGRFDSTPRIRAENSTPRPIPSFIDRSTRIVVHETWEYLNFQLLHTSTSVCTVTFFIATTCSLSVSYREKEKGMDIRYMYEIEERGFWYFDIELFDR